MKENEERKIPYQFTASPLNLMYILDSDCLKMLNLLIQEESYWGSKGQLVDGYFFKSINDLKSDMFMANDQDVRLTIEALYTNGIIDVINQGDKHKASRFKINLEKIKEIDSKSILEVKKFCLLIRKLKRGSPCSYMEKTSCPLTENTEVDDTIPNSDQVPESATNCNTDCHTNCTTDCNPTCTPKLDKSNMLNKSDSLNKIDNNIINNNIINNVDIEKESFHPLNSSIEENKNVKQNINTQEDIDASAPSQAAAHGIDSTNIITKEKELMMNFIKDSKEKSEGAFLLSIHTYTIEDLNLIDQGLTAENIPMDNKLKDMAKYWISKIKKAKLRNNSRSRSIPMESFG